MRTLAIYSRMLSLSLFACLPHSHSLSVCARALSAATLELTATKENAHSGIVSSVAFSPDDGKTIVSGSDDKSIKLWNAGEPRCAPSQYTAAFSLSLFACLAHSHSLCVRACALSTHTSKSASFFACRESSRISSFDSSLRPPRGKSALDMLLSGWLAQAQLADVSRTAARGF